MINKWEIGDYLDENAMQYSRYTIEDRAIVDVKDGLNILAHVKFL